MILVTQILYKYSAYAFIDIHKTIRHTRPSLFLFVCGQAIYYIMNSASFHDRERTMYLIAVLLVCKDGRIFIKSIMTCTESCPTIEISDEYFDRNKISRGSFTVQYHILHAANGKTVEEAESRLLKDGIGDVYIHNEGETERSSYLNDAFSKRSAAEKN
jgi:hypothetical protein